MLHLMEYEVEEITILDLLKAQGLEHEIQNRALTGAIASRLRSKGYVRKRLHRGVIWIKKDISVEVLNIEITADLVTRGL